MKEKKYSISEASRLLEVENHVLRYWEEELELNIPRNELGHRYYREEEIQLLNCIKELKNKGFQLKAVKEVLPDLEAKKLIDVHKLLATQVELENMGIQEEESFVGQAKKTEEYSHKVVNIRKNENKKNGELGNMANVVGSTGVASDTDAAGSADPASGINDTSSTSSINDTGSIMPASNANATGNTAGSIHVGKESLPMGTEKKQAAVFRNNEEKMQEFESIMGRIIGKALRDHADNFGEAMGDQISCRVARELDVVMEEREEREEARYKKLDETIRNYQKARQEIAVAKEDVGRKKSRFFRKNKRKI